MGWTLLTVHSGLKWLHTYLNGSAAPPPRSGGCVRCPPVSHEASGGSPPPPTRTLDLSARPRVPNTTKLWQFFVSRSMLQRDSIFFLKFRSLSFYSPKFNKLGIRIYLHFFVMGSMECVQLFFWFGASSETKRIPLKQQMKIQSFRSSKCFGISSKLMIGQAAPFSNVLFILDVLHARQCFFLFRCPSFWTHWNFLPILEFRNSRSFVVTPDLHNRTICQIFIEHYLHTNRSSTFGLWFYMIAIFTIVRLRSPFLSVFHVKLHLWSFLLATSDSHDRNTNIFLNLLFLHQPQFYYLFIPTIVRLCSPFLSVFHEAIVGSPPPPPTRPLDLPGRSRMPPATKSLQCRPSISGGAILSLYTKPFSIKKTSKNFTWHPYIAKLALYKTLGLRSTISRYKLSGILIQETSVILLGWFTGSNA